MAACLDISLDTILYIQSIIRIGIHSSIHVVHLYPLDCGCSITTDAAKLGGGISKLLHQALAPVLRKWSQCQFVKSADGSPGASNWGKMMICYVKTVSIRINTLQKEKQERQSRSATASLSDIPEAADAKGDTPGDAVSNSAKNDD